MFTKNRYFIFLFFNVMELYSPNFQNSMVVFCLFDKRIFMDPPKFTSRHAFRVLFGDYIFPECRNKMDQHSIFFRLKSRLDYILLKLWIDRNIPTHLIWKPFESAWFVVFSVTISVTMETWTYSTKFIV